MYAVLPSFTILLELVNKEHQSKVYETKEPNKRWWNSQFHISFFRSLSPFLAY